MYNFNHSNLPTELNTTCSHDVACKSEAVASCVLPQPTPSHPKNIDRAMPASKVITMFQIPSVTGQFWLKPFRVMRAVSYQHFRRFKSCERLLLNHGQNAATIP